MRAATFVYLLLFCTKRPATALFQCIGYDRKPVDWFVMYKLPDINANPNPLVQNGTAFLYWDSRLSAWKDTGQSLSAEDNNLALTLKQYYENRQNKVLFMLYNDQYPEMILNKNGHTKGVVLFDQEGGFWLVHSVPNFPNPKRYEWPSTATKYGQSFLCVTFHENSLSTISKQLFYNRPGLIASKLPTSFARKYPYLTKTFLGLFPRRPPYDSVETLTSAGGKQFVSFAKTKRWNKDLYSEGVAKHLNTSLLTETWRNGPGNFPSFCSGRYKVFNVLSIRLPLNISFDTNQDHSKWAVAKSANWVCIGDINRQHGQLTRAGGTMCVSDQTLSTNYRSAVLSLEACKTHRFSYGHAICGFNSEATWLVCGTTCGRRGSQTQMYRTPTLLKLNKHKTGSAAGNGRHRITRIGVAQTYASGATLCEDRCSMKLRT